MLRVLGEANERHWMEAEASLNRDEEELRGQRLEAKGRSYPSSTVAKTIWEV